MGAEYTRGKSRDEPGRAQGPHAPISRPTERAARRGLFRRLVEGLRGTTPPAGSGDPLKLGRYRILHRLGQGGMGIVFAAEDESLGRRVALKTIPRSDESARKRFRREARAAAGVNHPNVCQVYEIGEDCGPALHRDGAARGRAARRAAEARADVAGRGAAARQGMLSALQALHDAGTLHRDLKPSNAFLTPHGVKLLDFGLARPLPRRADAGARRRHAS